MTRQSGFADREPCPWRIVDDVASKKDYHLESLGNLTLVDQESGKLSKLRVGKKEQAEAKTNYEKRKEELQRYARRFGFAYASVNVEGFDSLAALRELRRQGVIA